MGDETSRGSWIVGVCVGVEAWTGGSSDVVILSERYREWVLSGEGSCTWGSLVRGWIVVGGVCSRSVTSGRRGVVGGWAVVVGVYGGRVGGWVVVVGVCGGRVGGWAVVARDETGE